MSGYSVGALFAECLAGSGNPACVQPGPPRGLTVPGRVAPPPPTGLTAVVTSDTVTLGWTAPVGGVAPTTYVLQGGRTSGASDLANFSTGNLLTTFTSPSLPSGQYFARVLARNGPDDSVASNEAGFTIAAGAPPGAPVLSFTLAGNIATLTWTTPKNRALIEQFRLSVEADHPPVSIATIAIPPDVNTYPTPPLPPRDYRMHIAAFGSNGQGPDSNIVNIVVPPPNTPGTQIIDDGDAGFTAPGFELEPPPGGAFGDVRSSTPDAGNTATWTFTGLSDGQHQVATTWTSGPDRANNALFRAFDETGLISQARVNQQDPPSDFTDQGIPFYVLDTPLVTGSTLTVELTDAGATGKVIADAVRIEP